MSPLKFGRIRTFGWDNVGVKRLTVALTSAKVAVLLVTHKFLASDFIVEYELRNILGAQRQGVVIVWIAVSASLYMETSLKDLQAANDPSHPLDTLTDAEAMQELALIAQKIKQLFPK